jgi:hypothetical protein
MPRRRFLVLLAFALVALAVRYLVIGLPTSSAGLPRLAGKTTQGANFHLTLGDDGRLLAFRTRITASCTHNQTWSTSWLAVEGHSVHFSRIGRGFVTRAYEEWSYTGSGIAHVAVTLRGTFTGRGSAQGTVRLVTRFYNGPTESYACDSRDVAWAVGRNAPEQLRRVTLGRVVGYYYPLLPSLPGVAYAKRKRIIDRADAICSRLIAHAPELSGLRRCSSYGGRTPVPILSDGQPRPLT